MVLNFATCHNISRKQVRLGFACSVSLTETEECDQDFDGLLLWEDFQEFVLRGLQPLLKGATELGFSSTARAI